jgi:transposase-like protein
MNTEQAISRGHGERKSQRRKLAIAALLTTPTVKAAARLIGVGHATLHRWLRDPPFAREVEAAKENILAMASAELQAGTLEAVTTLREVTRNKKAPASARVQAARVFLESTNLLRGLSTQVTVNNVPQDRESVDAAIRTQLHAALKTDDQFRAMVKQIISEVEGNDGTIQ